MTLTAAEIAGMRETVEGVHLGMTCTIERFTASGTDAYNQPTGTWAALHTGLACWWWEEEEKEKEGPNVNALVSRQRLALPANTDVTVDDRIDTVTGVDGTEVAGDLIVREVLERLNETVLVVEEQS